MRLNTEKKKHTENIVLVVDDNPTSRQSIRKILSSTCRVIDAIDPAILSNTYQQYLPNLVLIDMGSAMLDGQDAIKNILSYDPDAFIVLLGTETTQQAILEAKERGAKGFIYKPFKREIILKYLSLAQDKRASQKSPIKNAL